MTTSCSIEQFGRMNQARKAIENENIPSKEYIIVLVVLVKKSRLELKDDGFKLYYVRNAIYYDLRCIEKENASYFFYNHIRLCMYMSLSLGDILNK